MLNDLSNYPSVLAVWTYVGLSLLTFFVRRRVFHEICSFTWRRSFLCTIVVVWTAMAFWPVMGKVVPFFDRFCQRTGWWKQFGRTHSEY